MKHTRPLASLIVMLLFCPFFSGCTDFFDDNSPPTVSMSLDPSGTIKASESVTFSAVGTSDSDGDSLTFNWDFGDGNTGQGLTTSHSYASKGEFTVKLNVGDGVHETTLSKKISVVGADARQPYAEIKSDKQNDCEDEEPPSGDFVLKLTLISFRQLILSKNGLCMAEKIVCLLPKSSICMAFLTSNS